MTKTILTSLIAAVLAAVVTVKVVVPESSNGVITERQESTYERVMRTGKLRCGYNFYEPGFVKDEETGEFYGLYYDLLEAVGKVADIEIEWSALVGWGNMVTDIEAEKVDAFCISVWPNALRGKRLLFSDSFLYVNVEAYARAEDERFKTGDLSRVNSEDVTIAVLDADISDEIAKNEFPKAKKSTVTTLGSDADLFNELKFGKADVTFTTHSIFIGYDKKNPNILRRLSPENPLRTFGTTIALSMGEHDLKAMLDSAIEQLVNSGDVKRILQKYENNYPDTFFQVAKPYEELN